MHSTRVYFNNIGSICTDSLRRGNGLSALILLTRAAKSSAAKSSAAKSSAAKTRSMKSRLKAYLTKLLEVLSTVSLLWRLQVASRNPRGAGS